MRTTTPLKITHVTVWAPDGFGPDETAALTAVRKFRHGESSLRAQLVGLGVPADFTAPLFRPSAVWVSVTPFVAHRHLKRRGRKRDTPRLSGPDPKAAFVELALRELLERRGIGRLVDVGPLEPDARRPRPLEFRRSRSRPHDDGWRRPFGMFRIRFDSEVSGPVCLGYACHYGLGLFRPEAVSDRPREAR